MDIMSGIQVAALDSYSQRTGDAVTMAVMKKALDTQAASAAMLINSVAAAAPQPSQALPDNLGRNLNVVA